MAAFSQIVQNKRGRDEHLDSVLASPDAKRTNSGTLGYDCNIMALLNKIDSMDNINADPEDNHTVLNNVEGEMRLNVVINSVENKIGLKAQTDNNFEFTDEESSTEDMGSNKQGELTADGDSEAASMTFDMGDFPYYSDVCGDLGFFVDNFIPDVCVDADIMYLDAVQYDYAETTEVFYESLWEDDIWH